MAKYSVGGTEVIKDTGRIDWSKISGKPPASQITSIALSFTNCATGGNVSGSVGEVGAEKTINITVAT